MNLDPSRSRLTVSTFAEGLLSALAHDHEIGAESMSGEATESEGRATVTVRVPPASLRVKGVVKRGKLDESVLSKHDRDAIERQIQGDVLPGGDVTITGEREPNASRATLVVKSARGQERVTCDVTVTRDGDATRAKGRAEVSIAAMGAPPVKGPMGAFRVKDRVRVEFDLVFV